MNMQSRTPPSTTRAAAEATLARAMECHRRGQTRQAEALYEQILKVQPRHFDALHLSGTIAGQRREFPRALELIKRAITVQPDSPVVHAAYRNLGLTQAHADLPEEALLSFTHAVRRKPDFAEAYFDRAKLLQRLGRHGAALRDFDQVLRLRADHAESHHRRSQVLLALNQPLAALESIDRAIALSPRSADAHCDRGNALMAAGQYAEALGSFDVALELDSGHAGAHYNRGNVLDKLDRPDEALTAYDRALQLDPALAAAHTNRGVVLHELHRLEEALACYERALVIQPGHARARFNRGCLLLLRGDYARGWEDFEARWQTFQRPGAGAQGDFRQPEWTGSESLAGRSILLHAEQGLGDTVQFCRFATPLARRGARVVIEVQPELRSLLQRLDGVAEVIAQGARRPDCDYHAALMSLPRLLGTLPETIPAAAGYLRADPDAVLHWRTMLGPATRPRVGLAWSGSASNPRDRRRSIPAAQLLQALPATCDYFCLQTPVRASDAEAASSRPGLTNFGAQLDFQSTAALIELMDLVICVDTSIAHLAAALGARTWILLSHICDWRWLLGRNDSPWYSSVRLYRQAEPGSWDPVLRGVRSDMERALERSGA